MTTPKIVDRRNQALGGQSVDRSVSSIEKIVWHYTATLGGFITSHERYWRDVNGWDRGGYHYYIDRDGTIYWNYNHTRITWGVANNNLDTVHISLESDSANNYTKEQIASRDWLTRKLMKELNINSNGVQGHWEVYNNTSCPGYTRAEINNFRSQLSVPVTGTIATGRTVHTVKSGDTLYALSQKYKVSVDEIKKLNGLDNNLIVIGQKLVVSTGTPVASKPNPTLKPLDTVARDVIDGKYGNGEARIKKLKGEGYNPNEVQAIVDRILLGEQPKRLSLEAVAEQVIDGKFGNGADRKKNLEAKGYNYADVQAVVNRMATDNKPKATAKQYIFLPANNKTWGVYALNEKPISSNLKRWLSPGQFGGLEYEVLYWTVPNVAVIQTSTFGKVQIYVGPDTNAKIYTK
ncbi:N-acetylmuramoyl-L-alanine amidase [Jeotgalibaca porci]|uniref:N-acetylmuramoyl-L-alanine amidase n=1 Tax=Jeotgalibaca porci TaxID=1868793 RepID=UPI00359FA4DB